LFFPHFEVKSVTFIYCVFLFIIYIIEEIVHAANKSTSTWGCTLYNFGAKFTYAISKKGHIHRLLLPIILHSSFGHLFWNVLSFFMIGFSIEKAIGKWYKYIILIVFGGIGGNLFSSVISPYSVGIGASSSLFALLGFQLLWMFRHWQYLGPMKTQHLIFIGLITAFAFLNGFLGG